MLVASATTGWSIGMFKMGNTEIRNTKTEIRNTETENGKYENGNTETGNGNTKCDIIETIYWKLKCENIKQKF